eukprot:1347272-Amorphochlora_amoeboformis.AAC.1
MIHLFPNPNPLQESKVGLGDFIKAEDLINGQSGDKVRICILCLRLLADYPGMEVDTKQLRRSPYVPVYLSSVSLSLSSYSISSPISIYP